MPEKADVWLDRPLAGVTVALMGVPAAKGPQDVGRASLRGHTIVGYCRQGACSIRVADVTHVISAGEAFACHLAMPGDDISLGGRRSVGAVMFVDLEELRRGSSEVLQGFGVDVEGLAANVAYVRAKGFVRADHPEFAHIFAEMFDPSVTALQGYLRLKTIELLGALGAERLSTGEEPQGTASVRMSHERIARAAQAYILEDLSASLTIEQIAAACSTSPTVLKKAFKEAFGVPIHTWLRDVRVRRAAEELALGEGTIAEVARSVGYASPSKFTAAFEQAIGQKPSAWRRSHHV